MQRSTGLCTHGGKGMTSRPQAILGIIFGVLLSCAASEAQLFNPSPDTPPSSIHPRLHIGPGGHSFLVWAKEREGKYDLYFKRSTDAGQTWQEERWLDQDKPAGAWSTSPQMQSDGKGHVYVVWRSKRPDGRKDVLFTASKDF